MSAPETPTELAEAIRALVEFDHDGGEDGYSASADAMWKAALLAFNYAAGKVGATGFQASFAALKFYGEAMSIDGPFGVVKAEDGVYPQYDIPGKVQGWFDDDWRPWIVEQAQARLAEYAADTSVVAPRVLAHWQALAADGVAS